jgi:4-diphosphocytidyl-2-C-methyl-D-erythritol kinase
MGRRKLYNHPAMTVTLRSFAKINLGLRIGATREDGFHELLTVYQTIGLHDIIHVGGIRGSGIEIRCTDPRVPKDESNTCYRVAENAMAALRIKRRVVIGIEKQLPVQGGLGGASSNAVATLLGLERAFKKTLPAADRFRIAAEVGSDLPLFLVGGTVLGVGRGEQVYPLVDLPAIPLVVVTPEVGVSTPKAFAQWDRRMQRLNPSLLGAPGGALKRSSPTPTSRVSKAHPAEPRSAGQPGSVAATQILLKLTGSECSDRMKGLGRGLSAGLSELCSSAPSHRSARRGRAENPLLWLVRAGIENDFERVVFPEYPELGEGKRALLSAGAKYASLSGSGSTLYGLFTSREAARHAADRLRQEGWAAQATATLPRQVYWRRMIER